MTLTPQTFAERLTALDRVGAARLRKGELGALLGVAGDADDGQDEAYGLVAHLYGVHPQSGAVSIPRAARETVQDGDHDRPFMVLLDSPDLDRLGINLGHLVRRARDVDLGLDWASVTADALRWETPERDDVRRAWARAYWGERAGDANDELTIREVVDTFALNPHYRNVLARVAGSDVLPGRKSGRTWLMKRGDVERWLAHRAGPGRPPLQK